MLTMSGLKAQLFDMNIRLGVPPHADVQWALYGDPAYGRSRVILPPHKVAMTPAKEAMNTSMSRSRITVEWGFGKIIQYWQFVDVRQCLKMYEGPVQMYIENAAILTNLGTILYGHGSTSAFNCELNLPMSAYLA
jgi:hypothetical protein